ncbi:MAG: hypothetical protein H0V66_08440 [Bdellovibrionales bacterium]|nr:hypothetical protein [Bdellovibrionales bacterium]
MKKTAFLASLAFMSAAFGYEAQVTKGALPATVQAMLEKANAETQVNFKESDFYLIEDRALATSRFQMYVQHSQQIPVAATAIRIWSDKVSNELILAEMHLSEATKKGEKSLALKYSKAKFSPGALKSKKLSQAISHIIAQEVAKHDTDNRIISMKFTDQWVNGDLVRAVEVRGRRGVHHISVSLLKNAVVEKNYMEFPQSEQFQTVRANVFPIYEEVESTGEKLPYEVKELKFISVNLPDGGENPLSVFNDVKFPENRYHPVLAETEVGQQYDFWSEAALRRKVETAVSQFPTRANDFANGMLLQGKYATINLHPAAKEFKEVNFPLKASTNHLISWFNVDEEWEAKPVSGLQGKVITSEDDLLSRLPERLPDHDPVAYINSGFDEVQVYYGVTVLMDALAEMGFEDAELSTKPFHAFLYDPDLSMKDNAYYYDNTINFTTYNSHQANLARDNPTIWHELGHGVMERIMGTHLGYADSKGGYGGLSEGMADFVAKIIVEHQTSGADFPGKNDFRIINNTGFYLTNEFHDEGEAYGGAMNDMLDVVIAKYGREGLYDFTDLTLEAMRLTRNHPALSAKSWYEHMLYADELGSEVREVGQFKDIIANALVKRNFSLAADFKPSSMKVTFEKGELTNASDASRDRPLVECGVDGVVTHDLKIDLKSGDAKFIKFPAIVKVEFKKGALQGAIKWEGEETNPTIYSVNSEDEILNIQLKASMDCETVNQPDGSCKDYAYLQVFNHDNLKPVAKKRFYLKLNKAECI